MMNQNVLYNAERITTALKILLSIINNYELDYHEYNEDAYTNIITDTISLYDGFSDLEDCSVDTLECSAENFDVWMSMLKFFVNALKEYDFSDEFPVYNNKGEELIFNWKDELDILEYIISISVEV